MTAKVFADLASFRIVPVIEIDDPGQAVHLAEALSEGGLPLMEITLRTAAGPDAISAVSDAFPDFVLGAGSLLTPSQVQEASKRGAKFGVSPGQSFSLMDTARECGMPFIPGVVTPSEMISALEAGQHVLKFFPANSFGGAPAVKSLLAPFAGTGVTIMHTGGVNPENVGDYLAIPQVIAVGGSWIASREQIAQGRFGQIARTARDAVARHATSRQN